MHKICEYCGEPIINGSCQNEDEVSDPNCEYLGMLRCSFEECDCKGCSENKED